MEPDDGFIEDDFYEADEGGAASNRPFLMAAGGLVAVLLLSIFCVTAVLMARGANNNNNEEIAAIETQNAIIAVTNMAVTAAIEATQTADAQPTNTPLPTNTATPEPPTSTPTPVVPKQETAVPETAPEEETAAPTVDATQGAEAVIDLGGANTPTPTPLASIEVGKDDSLPQTGLDTWGVVALGAVLVLVLLGARRLRAG